MKDVPSCAADGLFWELHLFWILAEHRWAYVLTGVHWVPVVFLETTHSCMYPRLCLAVCIVIADQHNRLLETTALSFYSLGSWMHPHSWKSQETENYSKSTKQFFPMTHQGRLIWGGFMPNLRFFWKPPALLMGHSAHWSRSPSYSGTPVVLKVSICYPYL